MSPTMFFKICDEFRTQLYWASTISKIGRQIEFLYYYDRSESIGTTLGRQHILLLKFQNGRINHYHQGKGFGYNNFGDGYFVILCELQLACNQDFLP